MLTNPPDIMARTCIYPGTFDPVTNGHIDVIARASRLFDHIVVAVAENPGKGPLFTVDERVQLIQGNLIQFGNVTATKFSGLTIELARELGACALIRGLRALTDFEYEFQMALMNRHLDPDIETIFVMTKEAYSYTSSRLVKQVSHYGADIEQFVPPNVYQALSNRKTKSGQADVHEDH
jgi:pantetheine-phosphate adenylyltransferase